MQSFLNKLLAYYNLSKEDFATLSKSIEDIKLLDPNSISGMEKIKNRILKAIGNKEKIIVYGDYDCDGISATSIMVKTFQMLNYPVSYYIPSRYIDGYGINIVNVKKIAENGFKLLILVDNGICQKDEIDLANSLGLDVIVIDHHENNGIEVNALGIVHPFISNISSIGGSAGYMSLFVSAALLGKYEPYLVTIAGLSTISDMMELKEYNRDVVRLAIHYLRKYRFKKLISLCEQDVISEKSFGIEIAPKINAIGRMVTNKNINLLVKYLTSDDESYEILDWINDVNNNRKELTKTISDSLDEDFSNKKCIVIKLDVLEGMIGLVANRLLAKYNVPTIVFTENEKEKGELKGSIRSKEGFNVVKAFESLDKYLIGGGGHALAGGLTIKEEDFDSFKKDFEQLCEKYQLVEQDQKYIEISLQDINMENYSLIREFAPFGMGFKEPVFKIEKIATRGMIFVGGGTTLSTDIAFSTKLLGFNMMQKEVQSHPFIDILGSFNLSNRYGQKLEFRINEYKPSK